MLKLLSIFSILILFFPNMAFCDQSAEDKLLILSAKKTFNQNKLNKLITLKTSSKNERVNYWFDFWIIKLKIKKNPFDRNIVNELNKFSNLKKPEILTQEAYKFWAHEVIKRKNWEKTISTISYIKKVSPKTTSQSIKCINYLAKPKHTISEIRELTTGQEHRIGCLKLVLLAIEKNLSSRNFVFKSARSAAISGNILHAQQILELAKKKKIEVPKTENKLLKVLVVSQKNSLRALRRLKLTEGKLTNEQKSFASLVVGSSLLGITHPSTLKLIRKGTSSIKQQPVSILESTARVALRYSDWNLLSETIQSLPPRIQKLPKWKYWEAQVLITKDEKNKSAKLLDSIKPPWSFYGMLAGEDLARIYNPKKHIAYRIPPQEYNHEEIINSSSFKFALWLYEIGLYKEGRIEWENVLSQKSDKILINISKYVSSISILDRSISAALKTKNNHNFYLRFPTPYQKIIKKESSVKNISPFLMFSLIRQESRFKKKISSSAGAIGLMQLMPSTARSVARKIKLKSINKKSLTIPSINVKLGSEYLKILFSQFNESSLLTVASYNAGPSRSKKWKKSLIKEVSGAAFTESIPFDETRDYVKSVLSGTVMYSRLYDETNLGNSYNDTESILTLQSLLGSISPAK